MDGLRVVNSTYARSDVYSLITRFLLFHILLYFQVGEKNKKALVVTYSKDTPRPDPTNNSVSANNGTNGGSSDRRKARRVQRHLSS